MNLSVIIPTWNEEAALPQTLAAARAACPGAEIIVTDGGSTDETVAVARAFGAAVVGGARGRGRQQNRGAGIATGDILMFLHADTLLPPGARDAVCDALQDEQCIGGNFRLRFLPDNAANRLFASVYNFRARHGRYYYGDSVLWVRKTVFDNLGGFRETMLMEDWEFIRRMEEDARTHSTYTRLLPQTVETSARRFSGRRRLRYIGLWIYLHYLHHRGVSGDDLARLYPETR